MLRAMTAHNTPLDPQRRAERRAGLQAGLIFAAFASASVVVNALSINSELARGAAVFNPAQAWLLELTSLVVLLALVPAVIALDRRIPLALGWRVALPLHLIAALAFTTAHVWGMMLLRELLWPAVIGGSYTYFDLLVRDFIYEARKDFLTYATLVLVIRLARRIEDYRLELAEGHARAKGEALIVLKCGGRELRLPAAEIISAEAAGNYVEVSTPTGSHLARITLGGLETLLKEAGADPVRVHRSCLVARPAVREIIPGDSGDAVAVLSSGARIPVSRRYRSGLSGG